MKIAVCISGQPRSYTKGYEYLKKNVLDRYDTDIFIHTWKNKVYDIKDVIDLYNPVDYITDELSIFDKDDLNRKYTNTPDPEKFPPSNMVYAYYSLFQSCLLKIKNEIVSNQYDWVIKTRFDYAINGVIPFDKMDKTKIYIPNCRMVITRDFGNDQFAFGSSLVMNKYMSTYLMMEDYYNAGYQMNGEEMLKATLRNNNLIGENLCYVDMNNPFPAGPYNGGKHSLIRDDMELWKN